MQLLSFLSQFGKIQNVKLSRSKRTGNPRGYAFAQFHDTEVTSIVAETMNGYFLKGERRLVCHVVPPEKIHAKLFQGSKRNLQLCQSGVSSSTRIQYWQDKEREVVNKDRSMVGIKKITKRLLLREKKKREQLKKMGIDYDFPGYSASLDHVKNQKNDEDEQDSSMKKRKVSVDDAETEEEEEVPTPKASKKAKKTKSALVSSSSSPVTKRKISIDKSEKKSNDAASTPKSASGARKVESDLKKNKKKRKSKSGRKSLP